MMLDQRMGTLIWPARVEKLFYNGASFWTRPSRMWKAIRKFTLLYFILPNQLRDQVPEVRKALDTFVWAMRRLFGQVLSFENAVKFKILPGSRLIITRLIQRLSAEVLTGLSLLEGCLPVSHLNPALHHFVHVALYIHSHSDARILWMMGFERLVLVICNHNPNFESGYNPYLTLLLVGSTSSSRDSCEMAGIQYPFWPTLM